MFSLTPRTALGKSAKDLSINYVPVLYPDYSPAVIRMKPGERQLWRVFRMVIGDTSLTTDASSEAILKVIARARW